MIVFNGSATTAHDTEEYCQRGGAVLKPLLVVDRILSGPLCTMGDRCTAPESSR